MQAPVARDNTNVFDSRAYSDSEKRDWEAVLHVVHLAERCASL